MNSNSESLDPPKSSSGGCILLNVDQWVRGRLRSILRKRQKGRGRACGQDHHRWPDRYFEDLGLFSLELARKLELASLRHGAKR